MRKIRERERLSDRQVEKEMSIRGIFGQGTLTEGEGSVQLTSLLRLLAYLKNAFSI